MKKAKKITAALMAAALLASSLMFTGCRKNGNEEKISENETWYSVKKIPIGSQFQDNNDINTSYTTFIGATEDKAVFLVEIEKMEYISTMSGDNDDGSKTQFEIYGKDGELINTIDAKQKIKESGIFKLDPADYPDLIERLRKDSKDSMADKTDKEIFEDSGISVSWYLLDNYSVKDGCIIITVQALYPSNDMSIDSRQVEIVIDADSGEVLRHAEKDRNSKLSSEKRFEFDGFEVIFSSKDKTGVKANVFNVIYEDGTSKEIAADKAFPEKNDAFVESMLYLGDGKAMFTVFDPESFRTKYYEMNIKTGEIKDSVTDYSWLEFDLPKATYIRDVGYVIPDEEGLKKIDFENNRKIEIFSFDSCNINRNVTLNMKLLSMKEDCIFLSAYSRNEFQMIFDPGDTGEDLYILTKEKSNPNAGKTVIHATAMGFFGYSLCEAVSVFNDSNKNYFIKLDNNYSPIHKVNIGELNFFDDDYVEKYEKLTAELSYQLAIDLMNGDGPDIVIDGAGIVHLNNSNYLLDLKKDVNTKDMFGNIFKASEYDGKLYQVPLGVSITGILASKKDVAEDQYGLNFDQYKALVAGPCNGKDPISIYADQNEYFIRCLMNMKDSYYDNGKVNFDTPAFRALAEFTKDNVPVKRIDSTEYNSFKTVENSKRGIRYDVGLSVPFLAYYYPDSFSDMRVLGLPSYDGRGPGIGVNASFGISATTKEKKACLEFLKVLLSEEIQEYFCKYENSTPVRKTAYEASAKAAIQKYNSTYSKYKSMFSREQLIDNGYPWCLIDENAINDYEKMLDSCSVIIEDDAAITIIVREEMPAYFTGQKSLDDVIKIINDRAQTYVNERKSN